MKKEYYGEKMVPQLAGLNASARWNVEGIGQGDHFLRLMFFQPSDVRWAYSAPRMPERKARHYEPQPLSSARHDARYCLPDRSTAVSVGIDSPAIDVMTDLRHVAAITITLLAPIDEANRVMIANGVRALFVADHSRRVLGLVTATDILGEKPVKITHQRGIRHDEIVVRDIMTAADFLEVMNLDDILHAQVGDVIAMLKRAGRQHALVVDPRGRGATGEMQMIRGIFSMSQIARQLGITLQSPDGARSFAEIEAAIGV